MNVEVCKQLEVFEGVIGIMRPLLCCNAALICHLLCLCHIAVF